MIAISSERIIAITSESLSPTLRNANRHRPESATGELPREIVLKGRGTSFDHTRYSHNRETEDNPRRVWTLVRLAQSRKPDFERVLKSCLR